MRRVLPSLILGVALGVAGCGFLKPPQELDHDARQMMTYLRSDRLESARAMLRVNAPLDTVMKILAKGRDFIRPFSADSFTLVGWNVTYMSGGDTTAYLTYEARSGGRTAEFFVAVVRDASGPGITTFRWNETEQPLAVANAFTFSGKTVTHYLYVILAVLAVVTCIGGAVFAGVARLGIPWILISLVAFGQFSINWTTGATSFNPMSFQILGAGFVRFGKVAPWTLTWSIPVGTILMLVAWRQRKRRARKLAAATSRAEAHAVSEVS